MSLKRIEAEISGRVQGVGFRYYVIDKAEILGITGWVANLPDGGVKTVAVGEEELIHDFLLYLKKGPSSARVEDVVYRITDTDANEFSSFDIRYSY